MKEPWEELEERIRTRVKHREACLPYDPMFEAAVKDNDNPRFQNEPAFIIKEQINPPE